MKYTNVKSISEAQVQQSALRFLVKYYKRKARKGLLFSKMEVRTKQKYGGKRADGLIAFKRPWEGVFVASMEAKSVKTLAALKPWRDDGRLILNSLKAGIYFCIATGAVFALFKLQDGFAQYLLPLNIFLLGSLLYGLFTMNSKKHQVVDVVFQLRQYPADHQWLAFSKDSLNTLTKAKKKLLRQICVSNGVGVLIVNQRLSTSVWLKPKRKRKLLGDFLKYYSLETEVRKQLKN